MRKIKHRKQVGELDEVTMLVLALFVIVLGAFFFVKGVTGYF